MGAFFPMGVHLPSEKSILPYFSGPRGVAILDCDSHSQAGSTTLPPIDTLVTGMVPAAGVHWETMGGSVRIRLKSLDPDRQQRGRHCLGKDAQVLVKRAFEWREGGGDGEGR